MQPQQEELASPQFERVNSFLDSIGRRTNNSPRMYATGLGYFDRFLKTIQLEPLITSSIAFELVIPRSQMHSLLCCMHQLYIITRDYLIPNLMHSTIRRVRKLLLVQFSKLLI